MVLRRWFRAHGSRSSWALIPLLCVLAAACDESKPPSTAPHEPPLPPLPPLGADGGELALDGAATEVDGSAAQQVVAELRSSKLDVAPRRVPAQRIAFGKDRVVQLTAQALVVRSASDGKVLAEVPLAEPRRVATLADGSLLVAGKSEVKRVPSDPAKAESYSRLPLFMESLVFGDRRDKTRLWVQHGLDTTLFPYQLAEGGKLEILDLVDLGEFDRRGFTALKDGSFVYTAGKALKRFFPGGKSWTLDLPVGADVWRVLTTRRIDQVWLARTDGRLELVSITQTSLHVDKQLALPGPYDIAASDGELAVLRLEPASSGKRFWRVAVYDTGGKELWKTELPLAETSGSGEGWVQAITENRAIAVSSFAPLVAVGGPRELFVWNYKSGQPVLSP